MAKRKNQHIVPHSQGWAVKSEGSSRASGVFETQKEAIAYLSKKYLIWEY